MVVMKNMFRFIIWLLGGITKAKLTIAVKTAVEKKERELGSRGFKEVCLRKFRGWLLQLPKKVAFAVASAAHLPPP